MDIKETLLAEHSKAQCLRVVNWVGGNQQRFDQLFSLFTGQEYRVIQRAAWPVSYCVEAHPGLIKKHLGILIKRMQDPRVHVAVKRNSLRLLQFVDIPEKYQGELMNVCFDYITRINEAAAVKAFALTVLDNLSRLYPEIEQELLTAIETQWDEEGPAFQSRARRILTRLKR